MTTNHHKAACPEAWHGGLQAGLLRECCKMRGHRGWHSAVSGGLEWSGKLTSEERALADSLRSAEPQ